MSTGFRGPMVYHNVGHILDGVPWQYVERIHPTQDNVYGLADDLTSYDGPASSSQTALNYQVIDGADAAAAVIDHDRTGGGGVLDIETAGTAVTNAVLWRATSVHFRHDTDFAPFTFLCNFNLNSSNTTVVAGLVSAAHTSADVRTVGLPDNGLFFTRATGAASLWAFHARSGGTSTTVENLGPTFVTATPLSFGFRYDETGTISIYLAEQTNNLTTVVGTIAADDANIPTSTDLAVTFAMQASTSASVKRLGLNFYLATFTSTGII